jgi:hypothetical protein
VIPGRSPERVRVQALGAQELFAQRAEVRGVGAVLALLVNRCARLRLGWPSSGRVTGETAAAAAVTAAALAAAAAAAVATAATTAAAAIVRVLLLLPGAAVVRMFSHAARRL